MMLAADVRTFSNLPPPVPQTNSQVIEVDEDNDDDPRAIWVRAYGSESRYEHPELLDFGRYHNKDISYCEQFFMDPQVSSRMGVRYTCIDLCGGKGRMTRDFLSYWFKDITIVDFVRT